MNTDSIPRLTFRGRRFSTENLELIRQVVSDCTALGVTEIARTVCELLDWKRPSGRLKNHECRQLLERLRDRGWLQLPEVRRSGPRRPRRIAHTAAGAPQPEITGSVADLEPLTLTLVETAQDRALWNESIDRHHYLGYRVPVGASLRYLVRSQATPEPILACLLWSSPAWKMSARDRWIGWTDKQRVRNLQLVVNNSRFLVLPWVRVPGLASKILALCARRLPQDWERLYGYRPLLLETVVDPPRFAGPVIGRRTGFRSAKPAVAAASIDTMRQTAQHASWSTSIHSGATFASAFVSPRQRPSVQDARQPGKQVPEY